MKHWRTGVEPTNKQIKCIVNCEYCGNIKPSPYSKIRMSKSKNFFCNSSCQVKWQNKNTNFNKGTNNPSYIHGERVGGKSANYGIEFNTQLRRSIKIRDGYNCQRCKDNFSGCKSRMLDVHHIDHNKYNNDTINLISLCKKCHSTTHWEEGKNG